MHRLRLVAAALCFIAVAQSCVPEEKSPGRHTGRTSPEAGGGRLTVTTGVRAGHATASSQRGTCGRSARNVRIVGDLVSP